MRRLQFLLTHPVWDVTVTPSFSATLADIISTHTSRVGCDGKEVVDRQVEKFLLTHPVWDVTATTVAKAKSDMISTHTSRVGCDREWHLLPSNRHSISTHTSRVGCDAFSSVFSCASPISTHTSRVGCDANTTNNCIVHGISTHTSRVGCDSTVLTVPAKR